jgi:soluble lytic murein transglycosylase
MRAKWVLAPVVVTLVLAPEARRAGVRAEPDSGPPAPPALLTFAPPPAPPLPEKPLFDLLGYDPGCARLDDASVERRMQDALDAGDKALALAIGDPALAVAPPESRGRISWLLARAEVDDASSQARLSPLAHSDHLLARWAALRLGQSLLTTKASDAAALASPLTKGFVGARDARVLLARALHISGNDKAAEPLLRALYAEASAKAASATVALPLADLLAARRTPEGFREALELYRHVGARAAGTDMGDQADKLAKALWKRMRPAQHAALALPSIEDELARGQALRDRFRFEPAQRVFEKVAARARKDEALRCKAGLEAAHALFDRREREQAAKRFDALVRRCKAPEIKAWGRYYAGSARQRTKDPKGAAAEYEALVREVPQHSLADDALLLEAGAQLDAGDEPGSRKTLERLLAGYPKGDMRGEARFLLAFSARARGDLAEALSQLEHLASEGGGEQAEGTEGRAAYWRGRTLQDLGRIDEAKNAYTDLVRALPLSYHSQQALARLRELDVIAAAALMAELAAPGPGEQPLRFSMRSELQSTGFRTAIELLRVGEVELAQRELYALGMLGDGADKDTLWLVAATLNEAHAYSEASQLARARLRSFRSTMPQGRARQQWRIAYPHAFSPLIEQAAGEASVPPEFVRAIAREESDFKPDAVSPALAYGLIQLIVPTAKLHAKPLGLPSDPDSLKRPEVNLRIGAHFIKELWSRYTPNPAIVPAAYNAGYVAADRWLHERPSEPLDAWIEHIPYRETKRYTRRVLQSYGVYAWLDTGKLPELRPTLPVPPPPPEK